MQLIKTNKSVFFTSIAVLAFATTSLIASADARPHHRKSRHYVAATAGNPAIDDRYAHVAQGGFSMMKQQQPAMRQLPTMWQQQTMRQQQTMWQQQMRQQQTMRQQPTTRQSRRVARQGTAHQGTAHQGVTRQGLAMNTTSFGSSGLVAQARAYVGSNPTGRSRLWCARFLNMVLERSGRRGTGSDMANSFASYGNRISGPQVGAIAVMSRGKRGGHVGIVSGIDESGNPIVISGNHNGRVAEATYPRGRVYSYVMP